MTRRPWILVVALALETLIPNARLLRADEPTSSAPDKTPPLVKDATGPLQFQEVVQVDGASKDQLYSAALTWFGQTFGSGKEVLQTQDREGGTLVGRALFKYEPVIFMGSNGIRGVVRYTITLEFKDDRYRYTLGPFTHEGNPANPGGQFSFGVITGDEECPHPVYGTARSGREKTWTDLKVKTQHEAESIIASLKAKMATAATQKSDW